MQVFEHSTPSTGPSFARFQMPSSQLNTHDAYGRLLLTAHIKQILTGLGPPEEQHEMATGVPAITFSTALSPLSEDDTSGKNERKLTVLRKLRPPPFKYAWNFFHDKHSTGANYEGRLTLMLDNIVTVKPFWEAFNQFPLEALQLKDSVHFFKRGVKPVWEDPRNVKGGGWTFRVPKAKSAAFWKEVLILAVGEQFVDVIQPGKQLLLVSFLRENQ